MKKLLLVSFDITRQHDTSPWYSLASLVAYLKKSEQYGYNFCAEIYSLNLSVALEQGMDYILPALIQHEALYARWIGFACSVWSRGLINPTITALRQAGFQGIFILGGYEITGIQDQKNLIKEYPNAQIFIRGFAEESLLKVCQQDEFFYPLLLDMQPDFSNLPSPYLTNVLPIHTPMIRWETKRGCIFQCGFCSYRGLAIRKIYELSLERIFGELEFFQSKKIKKINVIDPIFHTGQNYITILKKIISMHMDTQFSFQARFEVCSDKFLQLCSCCNICLEFGLQSIHSKELEAIGRENDTEKIKTILKKLKLANIPYEISLMYGIPFQTVQSFRESIRFCESYGCSKICFFPLLLCQGTELARKQNEYHLIEETCGQYQIPFVTSGNSFTKQDWDTMSKIVENYQIQHNI